MPHWPQQDGVCLRQICVQLLHEGVQLRGMGEPKGCLQLDQGQGKISLLRPRVGNSVTAVFRISFLVLSLPFYLVPASPDVNGAASASYFLVLLS